MIQIATRTVALLFMFSIWPMGYAFADTPASKIIVQNKNLGLSTSRKALTLQDALTRLHKPAISYFKKPTGVSSLSGITWVGKTRVICFSGTEFTVREFPTTVVFNPSSDNAGTVVASPAFAGVEGGGDFCTTEPSGEHSGLYYIDGSNIFVQVGGNSFGGSDITIIDNRMSVTQGNSNLSWVLYKQ